jgi:carbonic anhydrase
LIASAGGADTDGVKSVAVHLNCQPTDDAVIAAINAALVQLYPMNARPVQKDNRRFVLRSS